MLRSLCTTIKQTSKRCSLPWIKQIHARFVSLHYYEPEAGFLKKNLQPFINMRSSTLNDCRNDIAPIEGTVICVDYSTTALHHFSMLAFCLQEVILRAINSSECSLVLYEPMLRVIFKRLFILGQDVITMFSISHCSDHYMKVPPCLP